MEQKYPTLIHKRVDMARNGVNDTVICRMKSGWAVLGDDQRLRGYSLLLHDPVVDNLNVLPANDREQFLNDMSIIGDALISVLSPFIVNYSILGNSDRALHAHIHPRYEDEEPDKRRTIPFIYHLLKMPQVPFLYERDKVLIEKLRVEIEKRMN